MKILIILAFILTFVNWRLITFISHKEYSLEEEYKIATLLQIAYHIQLLAMCIIIMILSMPNEWICRDKTSLEMTTINAESNDSIVVWKPTEQRIIEF